MRKDKKIFLIIESVLAVMVLTVAILMIQGSTDKEVCRISVIVPDSDHSRWDSFRYGLDMAASDYNVEAFVVSTGEILSEEDEEALIEAEIENGADGIIVQPVAGENLAEYLVKTNRKIPVMQIESQIDVDDSELPVTKPDHYRMGEALAEEILSDFGGNLQGKCLGIVSGEKETEAAEAGKDGVSDGIQKSGGEVLWSVGDYLESGEELPLPAYPAVDILIALDDGCLVSAGEAAAAGSLHGALVYGIGHSTGAFYYLDNGSAECLIVPDAFNVGYRSLMEVAKALDRSGKMESQSVSYTVIRRETLFSRENQNILFTMTQ